MNLLLVDDERQMHHLLEYILKQEGYHCTSAFSGEEALELVQKLPIDFILLDIMMEGIDGLETCRRIRQFSNVPIILLTAVALEENDKVKGLRAGADDYITKPFHREELVARIEAVYRRSEGQTSSSAQKKTLYQLGSLKLDAVAVRVEVHGVPITLTKKEYGMLLLFMKHPSRVFSREELLELIWGEEQYEVTSRTVDTHIKTLRMKLKEAGDMIKTVWGHGYRLEDQNE
ncbi:response regulator transcription factor [Paenalkalicoccus suaedae]|uniref:Response regulator transcription factor n=1 Tax=Paenalkalicoccus suaedae TaxID=2592382 RepID=A0A859F9S8_9BACI|nr:response regulator transcription factor [Paenalkalicoccus suaedae]QKS69943.1 response regulator transcription factor [Paenalkalicoccus suaedae]